MKPSGRRSRIPGLGFKHAATAVSGSAVITKVIAMAATLSDTEMEAQIRSSQISTSPIPSKRSTWTSMSSVPLPRVVIWSTCYSPHRAGKSWMTGLPPSSSVA